jgi:ClpP class serine protease
MKLPFSSKNPIVPVLRLDGVIDASSGMQRGISLAGVAADIEKAFETKGAVAVAIVINSPGGSPVQSHAIHDRIRALADENELPVYAFVEDFGL